MPDQPVISFSNVSFAYDRLPVLRDVSFDVQDREAICIVGPNGGGKTTLAKLILGLIRPGSGRVRVFGRAPNESRLRIGYMPQHLNYDPSFPAGVMDIVLTGRLGSSSRAAWLGWYSAADRRIAREALAEVGMEDLGKRPLSALSGGQRQRVLIARALCCRPDILLLDEPTANLDTPTETRLFEILRRLNRRMTILIVSHDVGFVSNLVEKVVCVNRDVVVHPTKDLDGRAIHDLYEGDVRMVLHSDRLDSTNSLGGAECCSEHQHGPETGPNAGDAHD